MAIGLQNTDNIVAPGGSYPYGRVKDDDGTGNGTPANTKTLGDFHQFFARLMSVAGLTPSGTPDNFTDGFQYIDALMMAVSLRIGGDITATDLNNATVPGIFNITNSYTNSPSGISVTGAQLIVAATPSGAEIRQRIVDVSTGAEWARIYNGSWSAWSLIRLAVYRTTTGTWNMNTTTTKNIALPAGMVAALAIRKVSVFVSNDPQSAQYDLFGSYDIIAVAASASAGYRLFADQIQILLDSSSVFVTNSGWSNGSINRGVVTVEYVPY